jgi:hypothetical protein
MNVTLISDGVPNISSEQANNDPWIFVNEFKKRKIKVDYICLINKDINTSNIKNDKLLKLFKSKFKNLNSIEVINLESKEYLVKIKYFFLKLFTKNPNYFYGSKVFNYKVINHIEKINNKKILCFYEIPISIGSLLNSKFSVYNYLGAYRKKVEIQRFFNLCNSGFVKNFFKIINCLIYVIKINSIYKVVLNKSKINFCPSFDTVTDLKKINIKNLYYSKPLSKNLSHLNKKSSSSTVLLIGNLRSTFMINSLIELSNNLINNLARLKKKYNFRIRIVGKFKPSHEIQNKLNYSWIKFSGWVKNSDLEYKNAKYLFAPNTYALSARTKIIEAMSCGTIVFTYEQNIKGIFKYMKNFKNILIAKNSDMFIKQFKIILKNKALQKKISKNAKILYHKHYRPSLIVKKNIDLILK